MDHIGKAINLDADTNRISRVEARLDTLEILLSRLIGRIENDSVDNDPCRRVATRSSVVDGVLND